MNVMRANGLAIDAPDVAAVFAEYPAAVRAELLALRRLILETGESLEGVGTIEEDLRWGQPSYLTSETGSGTTIRIAATGPQDYAMFFICRTNLIESFKKLFGDAFTYDSNRALVFHVGEKVPVNELRECVAMALTYHRTGP